ncbi:MAG: AarF/ABC1/UbiB kinase family protein [Rhodocyclaceae bacterium]|nr:AarF/ABC1/UbiB kinase family protein [Rhodocyclaceae bacterium]MBK6908967.1 AarF/ABC1/UbiB kinase family protein [Rhodocyclaceae bacterium]
MKDKKVEASAVPSARLSRLARLGGMASGIAGNILAEGVRQLAQGKRPSVSDLLLTPKNAQRIADQLAQMRGAAMKLGQMLSMDAGDLLPPELTAILGRLRSEAHHMPREQLMKVLNKAWGKGWEAQFAEFDFTPVAAASIGQVHAARTHDGEKLAIKVQYPGVRQSIDSDVANVVSLLRMAGLVPRSLDIDPLVEEAKRQLHEEADYVKEGKHLAHYGELLAGSDDFVLPRVVEEFTRKNILAMSFIDGTPIEDQLSAPQARRDRLGTLLFSLLVREMFEFRRVQTDPNFANYRYDPVSDRLVLLDFGATRVYRKDRIEAYHRLLSAGMHEDRAALESAARDIGYFQADSLPRHKDVVIDIFMIACEPLRHAGTYDFGQTDMARRINSLGMELGFDRDYWHTPPVDAIFLHRKIGGVYLLAARLQARVDVRACFLTASSAGGKKPAL